MKIRPIDPIFYIRNHQWIELPDYPFRVQWLIKIAKAEAARIVRNVSPRGSLIDETA